MKDFTLRIYKELLKLVGPGNYTLSEYLKNRNQKIILRHDVDRPPKNVIRMAEIEYKKGVKSSYFFRVRPKLFKIDIISKVKELGHEVGYHYEVLDKSKGDYNRAIKIFKKEWTLFKKWDAKTICMHGNPFSNIDNKKIWEYHDYKKFDILGEAYLSVNFGEMIYITDTGRRLNNEKLSMKDKVSGGLISLKNTKNLIDLIKKNEINRIYLVTHPSRWNDSLIPWLREFVWQNIKNLIKFLLHLYRFRLKKNNLLL